SPPSQSHRSAVPTTPRGSGSSRLLDGSGLDFLQRPALVVLPVHPAVRRAAQQDARSGGRRVVLGQPQAVPVRDDDALANQAVAYRWIDGTGSFATCEPARTTNPSGACPISSRAASAPALGCIGRGACLRGAGPLECTRRGDGGKGKA